MDIQHRAWATLDIKSIDNEQRVITGIASTPTPDRHGDSMDPAGAQFTLPMPFLWKHKDPIGEVFAADVRPEGIFIKARISTVSPNAPAALKDLIDTAWHSMTAKPPLVRGLSIGWWPLQMAAGTGAVKRFTKWIWGETSAVVVGANAQATILSVKSADLVAAPGTPRSAAVVPGASGSSRETRMNVSESLTQEKGILQTKSARLEELMQDEQTHGSLDAEQITERDTLLTDVKSITGKVSQLETLEAAQGRLAGAVRVPAPMQHKSNVQVVNLPKGTAFTRYAIAVAAGKGSISDTLAFAKRWDAQTPEVSRFIKSEAGSADGGSPGWGRELVNPDTMQTEFVELLNPMTIIGKVNGFRTVPFNIPIITQTGGSTFEWVGEAGRKPVGQLDFTRTTLDKSKVAGIIVLTEELIRLSRPDAEATVRRDLLEQAAKFLDEQFIQVGVSAGPNNPASITNNVTSPTATGSDMTAFLADLNIALATFDDANIPTNDLVIVTTPAIARGLSTLLTPLGSGFAFPSMSPSGGSVLGYPVIVSSAVDSGVVVIFKPSEIFLADDGRVTLDASNQATLDMGNGSPEAPTFNLWQRNCVGIRAERWIRWQKRRADVVAVIDTASYGPSVGSP